jgi:hypothetical protein
MPSREHSAGSSARSPYLCEAVEQISKRQTSKLQRNPNGIKIVGAQACCARFGGRDKFAPLRKRRGIGGGLAPETRHIETPCK